MVPGGWTEVNRTIEIPMFPARQVAAASICSAFSFVAAFDWGVFVRMAAVNTFFARGFAVFPVDQRISFLVEQVLYRYRIPC